eukprot:TRINITY_DN94766_c0_g1_i1.p2 TRINITY_DN94766_c0_g1~~TRINITY_DN94766_c0_g1_i1.p2  ORF type:complete len:176 (+),score=46.96 TRINITY_DN94766_c0_g1_i1:119-646(+)
MAQSTRLRRIARSGVAIAAAVAALMLIAPSEGFSIPRMVAPAESLAGVALPKALSSPSRAALDESTAWGPSMQGAARCLLAAGIAVAAARSLVQRRAVPKHRSALHTTRRRRIRWCQKGERRAMQALSLAKQIKKGTANFIYGRPQDEEDYEDDDYEDDEFEDEDDDELEKKALA